MRAPASVVAAAVLLGPPLAAEALRPKPPVFGGAVEAIQVNVSVTNARSQHVTDLTVDDFMVLEDGVLQRLSWFRSQDLPVSLVLMMDTSGSMGNMLPAARAAARGFVGTLGAADSAQVVQFNDRARVLQDFTGDHALLNEAIERTEAMGSTALYNAVYVALKDIARQRSQGEPRRLAIVLLSDGEDTLSRITDEQVLELARRTEVAVYPISLRAERVRESHRSLADRADHFLTVLARESGGHSYFARSAADLEDVYSRIARELRTQYGLGYVSSNPARDGRWRRIVVQTPARADLLLRHKIGYYAPRP